MKANELRKLIRQELSEIITVGGGRDDKKDSTQPMMSLRNTMKQVLAQTPKGLSSSEAAALNDLLTKILSGAERQEITVSLNRLTSIYNNMTGGSKI